MLFRKLIRTMGQYRAQFISMILMIAIGIGMFVGFNVEWYSLEDDTMSFLRDTHFADFRIVRERGFSAEDAEIIRKIDGVERAARFLTVKTTVKDTDDVVALNVTEDAGVSGILVTAGKAYDAEDENGLWVSDRYAEANGIGIGDTLTLQYKALDITGIVKGFAKSGEYLICVPDETQLMPDYTTYGFAYASPAFLKKALGFEFYSQINVLSELDKKAFAENADQALGETLMILEKDDTISYAEAKGESKEGKTMAAILPVFFLAIAVLTMVTTMHRLTAAEKTQIGTLKSLGFKDRRILRHYTFYALLIGLLGTGGGIALGWWLGWFIMNPGGSMGTYLDMPSWKLSAPPFTWIVLIAVNAALGVIGAFSVKSMLRGTAADSLRPYTPKKVRATLLERTPLWERLSFGTRWNLRDCLRHKTRTFMTLFGIIGCMLLVVAAVGMLDTMDEFMAVFYDQAIRYETKINLDTQHATREDAERIAEAYDGDMCAQVSVQIDGKSMLLEIYSLPHELVRFPLRGESDAFASLPDDAVLICERIAKNQGLAVGDTLTFSPFGSEENYTVKVGGIVRTLSKSFAMSEAYADRIGLSYTIGTVYTAKKDVAADNAIVNTQSKQNIVDSFDTFMDIMKLMIRMLIVVAALLGGVVLYNLATMSYTERYREMATLKVIGFKDGKIGRLLIGENLMLTVIGSIIGIPAGIWTLKYLLAALASEYELKLAVSFRTYAVGITVIFSVSLAVGLMIARKNRGIDMVEALKGQE